MKLADLWTAFEIAFCEKKAAVGLLVGYLNN